ncbi:MAG: hypothetical protein J6B97_09185 [Bacteroidales bacterium]|nr:hypothetical protein [Bacteroidales bacterium]
MTDEILMAAAQMTPNDLMHYGVKGQKWGVRRTPAELAAASGGPGGGASVEDVDELEEKISENEQKLAEMKADGAYEKEIRAMEASIKAGKERVNQILDAERRNGAAFEHAMSFTPEEIFTGLAEDELFLEHHGIKGQKWGVRRFQPYRQGMKVAGGKVVGAAKKVKQRFKDIGDARQKKKAAKLKAKTVKKAQATRKANANFEAEKKKAIESGSIEDLAKFKGKLTNEEYSKAFLRLQNEKKMSDMVAANQKTVWDTIDKGMSIVQKVGGYANTIATAKENFSKLDKAFNGERDKNAEDAKKSIKDAEKNRALTQVTNIDELNRAQKEHNLNADDYAKGLRLISTKEAGKKVNEDAFTTEAARKAAKDAETRSDNGVKKNASYDNSDPKDFKAPPRTLSEKAGYKNPDGETGYTRQQTEKAAVESGKRIISGFKSGIDKPVSYNSQQTLSFGESTVKRLSAKPSEPSKIVTDTRKTVADTQAEAARQREVDEKRKKALGK